MPSRDAVSLREATAADIVWLELWNRDDGVVGSTTDDGDAVLAFGDTDWAEELAMQSDVFLYYIAEADERPVGVVAVCDPHLEPTHYWGHIEPNLRAIDIWIGSAEDRGRGYGTQMMRAALELCFADVRVTGIVIDPLASNARAHKFYRKLGFEPVGRRRFGDDDCLVHALSRYRWEMLAGD
jgi:aminoglycoside 6'-N-acetyltransferase